MNWTPFTLLFVGFFLVVLEFFLPGGVMGIAGGAVLLASIIFFGLQSGSFLWALLYTLVILAVLIMMIRFTLKRIKKGKVKGIFLSTAQEGYVASEYAKELIGKQGEALSDLKPSGHILVEGKRYQAVSKVGYLHKGTHIIVTGGEGAHLTVKVTQEKS